MAIHTEGLIQLGLLAEFEPGSLLLRLLPAFRKSYPQIRFNIEFAPLASLEERLVADKMHFALIHETRDNDFLQKLNVGTVDYVAVASRSYAKDRGPLERAEQILLADWIDLAPDMPLVSSWVGSDATLSGILGHVRPAFTVPCFQAALELAITGCGLTFLPRLMVKGELASGSLVELTAGHTIQARPLQLLYRKRTARQLFESLFLEYLLDQLPLTSAPANAAGTAA